MRQGGIIDAHVHAYPPEVAADPAGWGRSQGEPGWSACVAPAGRRSIQGWADTARMIADMDGAGVASCVMLGWYWERQETCELQNRWYGDWVRGSAGRLLAFAAVQPRGGRGAVDALERALDRGLCGVGEVLPQAQGFTIDDPWWRRVVEVAQERGVPVTLHATDPGAGPAAGPKTPLEGYLRLAREHPRATFILAHWGGGMAFRGPPAGAGPLPANVYFDTAASPLLYPPSVFRRAADLVGAGRIVYGSDYPLILHPRRSREPGFSAFLDEIRASGLGEGELRDVLGGNIRRLLSPGLARGPGSM
jgi:predicted TIM-barrel fold metal-dependent hydrolase